VLTIVFIRRGPRAPVVPSQALVTCGLHSTPRDGLARCVFRARSHDARQLGDPGLAAGSHRCGPNRSCIGRTGDRESLLHRRSILTRLHANHARRALTDRPRSRRAFAAIAPAANRSPLGDIAMPNDERRPRLEKCSRGRSQRFVRTIVRTGRLGEPAARVHTRLSKSRAHVSSV
jgi:hypothetical protein